MGEKFPHVTYSLSRNIIKYRGLTSLRRHSLVLCIERIFKESRKYEEYGMKCDQSRHERKNIYHFLQGDWKNLINFLEKKIREELQSFSCNLNWTYIRTIIKFMVLQIIDFISNCAFSIHVNLSQFLGNLVFTCEGSINLKDTISRVLEKFDDKPLEKHEIMCYHFTSTEKEIKTHYDSLPQNVQTYFNLEETLVENYCLYFWMWEIKISRPSIPNTFEDNPYYRKWLNPSINKLRAYENIFVHAIETNNEMAVEYLWEHKISNMKEREGILNKVVLLTFQNSTKTRIFMFLLLQVNKNELTEFLKPSSSLIIKNIINDRWRCVFLEVFKELQIYFSQKSILEIFGILTNSKYQDLGLVADYFSLLCETAKGYVMEEPKPIPTGSSSSSAQKTPNNYGRVLVKAFENNNKKLLQKLRPRDDTAFKNFLSSESGEISLAKALENGDITFINEILKDVYKEGLTDFKRTFLGFKKSYLCKYFIINLLYNEMVLFLDLFSDSKKNIPEFKKEILDKFHEDIIFSSKAQNAQHLENVNSILKWFLESEEKVSTYKKSLNLMESSKKEPTGCYCGIRKYVLYSKFNYLTKFFEWKGIEVDKKNVFLNYLLTDEYLIEHTAKRSDIKAFLINFSNFLQFHRVSEDHINKFINKVRKNGGVF